QVVDVTLLRQGMRQHLRQAGEPDKAPLRPGERYDAHALLLQRTGGAGQQAHFVSTSSEGLGLLLKDADVVVIVDGGDDDDTPPAGRGIAAHDRVPLSAVPARPAWLPCGRPR